MANLTEVAGWVAGIYQLETTDVVEGGEGGIDNLQAQQLANRTQYLKALCEALGADKQPLDATLTALAALGLSADKMIYSTGADAVALTTLTAFARSLLDDADAATARATLSTPSVAEMNAAIAALVNSSPAALDTLNELAAALGNDANFATTMTNALALKAPLASPALTGNPTAPTQIDTDNSTKLATTAWVRAAMAAIATAAGFAFSFAANGYIKFPSWLGSWVFQWSIVTTNASGVGTVSWAVAFPTAVYANLGCITNAGGILPWSCVMGTPGTGGSTALVCNGSGVGQVANVAVIAVGK